MSDVSSKKMAVETQEQAIRLAFNPEDKTIATGSFVSSKINHKITLTLTNSVTEDYSYFDGATLIQILRVIYTDSTKATLSSVERIV